MRMELIQPFINAADAVFAESLQGPTKIAELEMDENTYRRKGVAALITIKGDIEGRVILDLSPEVAVEKGNPLAGGGKGGNEQKRGGKGCGVGDKGIRKFVALPEDKSFLFQRVSPA